jgi:hypothetical protein
VRKCHFCHEGIADAARVCLQCSADLIHRPPRQDVPEPGALIKDRIATFEENRTLFQSAALFVILVVIYAIYLQGIVDGTPKLRMLSDLAWPLAKFCLISGAPFAVLAFVDRDWGSEDAAPVALAAWVAVFWFFSQKYDGGCPMSFALFFLPLVLSALAAHKIARASPFQSTP